MVYEAGIRASTRVKDGNVDCVYDTGRDLPAAFQIAILLRLLCIGFDFYVYGTWGLFRILSANEMTHDKRHVG